MGTLLVGAVGGPNFGDELILNSWLMEFRARGYESTSLYVDGYGLENLSAWLPTVSSGASVIPNDVSFWRNLSLINLDCPEKRDWLVEIRRLGESQSFIDYIDRARAWFISKEISHIHFIGGGYINSIWPTNYGLLLFSSILSVLVGARLTLSGQGFLPSSPCDAVLLKAALGFCSCVDVRDEASYLELNSTERFKDKVTISPDDIAVGFARKPFVSLEENPSLIICLQNDLFDGFSLLKALESERFATALSRRGLKQIVFLKAMEDDVAAFSQEFTKCLQEKGVSIRVVEPFELVGGGLPVNHSSFVITTRYHVHYIGFINGLSGAVISTGDYYQTKHNEIKKLGSCWECIDARQANSEALVHAVENAEKCINYRDKAPLLSEEKLPIIDRVFQTSTDDPSSISAIETEIIRLAMFFESRAVRSELLLEIVSLSDERTRLEGQLKSLQERYKSLEARLKSHQERYDSLADSIKLMFSHRWLKRLRMIAPKVYTRGFDAVEHQIQCENVEQHH